jgi:hypothetical protein
VDLEPDHRFVLDSHGRLIALPCALAAARPVCAMCAAEPRSA